jgi:hypothetical protein
MRDDKEEQEEQQTFFTRMVEQYAAMAAPVLSKYHEPLTEADFQKDTKPSLPQREDDIK